MNEETYADDGFWGMVVREMVERGFIESPWLAANRDETQDGDGMFNIDCALDQDADAKVVDKCVRRIFRSMCHRGPRGRRVVFDDFSLGKSWWRWRWANRMSELLSLDRDDILEKILTGGNYSVIAAKMHSGRSYLSPEEVFGDLILFLGDHQDLEISSKVDGAVKSRFLMRVGWVIIVHVYFTRPTDRRIV